MSPIFVTRFLLLVWSASIVTSEALHSRHKRADDNSKKDPKLSDSLKWLAVGQEPKIRSHNNLKSSQDEKGPVPPPRESKADRQARWVAEQQRIEELTSGPWNRFEGKHLFENGIHKGAVNSFNVLSSDPLRAKQYLVDVNVKVFQGAVLPEARGNQFQLWMENVESKMLSIVDADVEVLKKDLKSKFDSWSKEELSKHGEVPQMSPDFMTKDPYKVTHITYILERNAKGEVVKVHVKAERFNTRVELGTDDTGKPSHFNRLNPEDVAQPRNKLGEKIIATFTVEELRANAELTHEFWKQSGVPFSRKNVILNEDHPDFKQLKSDFKEKFEEGVVQPKKGGGEDHFGTGGLCRSGRARRRRSAENCAIFFNEEGEVESISPEELVEEYKKAGEDGKEKLTNLVKDNLDKISDPEGLIEGIERVQDLVHLEELKTHVKTVDNVMDVQDVKNSKSSAEVLDTIHDKFSDTQTKGSGSRITWQLEHSKAVHGFVTASDALGQFFLAKTVINGIIHGDKTSLAIVGARVGYDIATGTAVWAGAKFFGAATKVGKASSILGKFAGPIGAVADIELSLWSLSKSVDRLQSAKNKYERDDAIADIVSSGIDIAVTFTVTAVSLAFPPLAPVAAAVGVVITFFKEVAVSIFKASNEVARIDSEIGLLGFEKTEVFTSRWLDVFGTRKLDYVDYLLQEKAANDMAVVSKDYGTVAIFLYYRENQAFLGVVFPSRTLAYDGGCRYTKQFCSYEVWFFGYFCLHWDDEVTIGEGCDRNRPCPDDPCTDSRGPPGSSNSYTWYSCKCDKKPETTFGFARLDSLVDFRENRTVYWERDIPSDVQGTDFKCKPGSVNFQGYQVSKENPTEGYLCENAIALLQPRVNRTAGQAMMFDLKDGHDQVFLPETDQTPNVFLMGNGTKEFHVGQGRNEFVFDGDCEGPLSGNLFGGRGNSDVITISDNCSLGHQMSIDFSRGVLQNDKGNLKISFVNFEEVNGRPNQGEHALVECATRKVMLRGGSQVIPDEVVIPEKNCSYNLTVLASAFMNVESKARNGSLTFLVDKSFTTTNVTAVLTPNNTGNSPHTTALFASTPASEITPELVSFLPRLFSLKLRNLVTKDIIAFSFNLTKDPEQDWVFPVYFTESPAGVPYSVLLISQNSIVFYHTLPPVSTTSALIRKGCPDVGNTFEILGPNWNVSGGNKSDEFVLHSPSLKGIQGGGGEDTLKLHEDLVNHTFSLDLGGTSVENVFGNPKSPEVLWSDCDTKVIVPMGGSLEEPDSITVPARHCLQRDLQIVAQGNTKVVIEDDVRYEMNDTVRVVAVASDNFTEIPLQLDFQSRANNVSGLLVAIEVTHKNWTAANGSWDPQEKSYVAQMLSFRNESIKVTLKDLAPGHAYLTQPYIQISNQDPNEPPAQLLISRDSSTPTVRYTLDTLPVNITSLSGFNGVSNMFNILNDSWHVIGGGRNDVFFLLTSSKGITINGGNGGENALILVDNKEDDKNSTFRVNLEKKSFGFLGEQGSVHGIHHVIGRDAKSDMLYAACTTKSLSGRGGAGRGLEDVIFVSGVNCSDVELTIETGNFTRVTNSAPKGVFAYHVEELLNSDFNVQPSKDSFHLFNFRFNPWQVFESVKFQDKDKVLTFELINSTTNSTTSKLQRFKMFRGNDSEEEFTNPEFKFQVPGSSVTSDIRVFSDGLIAATIMVHEGGLQSSELVQGLPVPVNRFLVNVTQPKGGGILRGSDKSSANQFWVFNLTSTLEVLDGGDCSSNNCTNYLHCGQGFHSAAMAIDLNPQNGSIKIQRRPKIVKLQNIHEFHGRSYGAGDTAWVHCSTKKISRVDYIRIHSGDNCSFDLSMGVGQNTTVRFKGSSRNSEAYLNSVFHYHFTVPRSFDPEGYQGAWMGPSHNYFLAFTIDDLSFLRFDVHKEKLSYSINGTVYSHSMLSGIHFRDQFYPEPTMRTKDGFRIQIARDGSLMLTMVASSGFPVEEIHDKVVPAFVHTAKKLGVTIILQTDSEFLYIGHGNVNGSRNVLQNVRHSESHLVGGGADNTIYEIVALDKDTHIYPGFEDVEAVWNGTKQTLDLTDVVVPMRLESGTKFVPEVVSQGGNLIMKMKGFEKEYPGKIIIEGGGNKGVAQRLQVLLYNSLMDLVQVTNDNATNVTTSWKIQPRPITVSEGFVYSVAGEDLEDGQDLRLNFTTISEEETKLRFTAARNGSDLYLSDILDRTGMTRNNTADRLNITNIIITDFFKATEKVKISDVASSIAEHMPSKLKNVTISLPGLELILNDYQVVEKGVREGEGHTETLLSTLEITEWKCVLHTAEGQVLQNMPDIQRVFHDGGCLPQSLNSWEVAGLVVAGIGVLGGVLMVVARKAMLWRRRNGYQPIGQEER